MDNCIITIPYKFPSLNEYINDCRTNRYKAAQIKADIQRDIAPFIKQLPRFNCPVQVNFLWIEGNKKRDYDNVAFAKKYILDAMVQCGVLKDDNRKCVVAFSDTFEYGKEFAVVVEVVPVM